MLKDLEILEEMQKLDDKITKLQVLIKRLPEQLSNLKDNVKNSETRLAELKHELELNRKEQDLRELSIKSNKEQSAKYQNQLLAVQTNKEYKALNKEVSHLEHLNTKLEDEIMELMEAAEELKESKLEAEKQLKAAEKELKANEQRLEDEIIEVEKDMDRFRSDRKELAKNLPVPLIKKYVGLIKNRDRKAVVYNVGNACGGCGFMIRPQVLVELHEGNKIVCCEGCSRIIILKKEK